MKFNIPQIEQREEYENLNIVLILGESLSRTYMHCYGYPIENTPKIDSLCKTKQMFKYNKAVSPAESTLRSMERILTYASTEEEYDKWYSYPTLMQIFSNSNFWVQWLSNQDKAAENNSIYMIAQTSDSTYYSIGSLYVWDPNSNSKVYDEVLLPKLMKSSDIKQKKNLFQIVHLMGNHFTYKYRFPDSYKKFTINDLPKQHNTLDKSKQQNVVDYMNSVYYNDYIVSQIIDYYKDEDAFIIYLSDHGQSLYDNPKNPNNFGHSVSYNGLSIPMFIYTSDKFISKYPKIYQDISKAIDRPFKSDLLTHSLTALFGLKTKYSNPKLELFNDNYNSERPIKIIELGREFSFQ